MNTFWNLLESLLGLAVEPKNLTFIQISLRGIIVMVGALVMIRLGTKRSLAEKTAFDAVSHCACVSPGARRQRQRSLLSNHWRWIRFGLCPPTLGFDRLPLACFRRPY